MSPLPRKPIIGVIVLILLALVGFFLIVHPAANLSPLSNLSQTLSPASTPFPFQELTIPYLKSRPYQSRLGELEPVAAHTNYTAYLTSYDSDGLRINAFLTKPSGDEPAGGWPAIVFVHGYISPTLYSTLEKYADYVDYLARNGFVVFKIDLRSHANSEGTASGAYYSGDYIIDTLNARTALSSSGFVNPDKVGLWGHSMAGNIVLRSLAAAPDIPAVVIWAGAVYTYSDMREYGINDNSYRPPTADTLRQREREKLRAAHGDFNLDDPFWQLVPATNFLGSVKGAIQIHHAVGDPVVSIDYSRNLNKILDQTNIPHQLIEYPSGGHNITGANFTKAMANTVEFFHDHLQ